MDSELEERIDVLEERADQSLRLARENNEYLKKLYRAHVWSRTFRIVYWTLVIGAAVGVFYFLQPYIDSAKESYTSFRSFLP